MLGNRDIHVWVCSYHDLATRLPSDHPKDILDDAEIHRMGRIRSPRLHQNFVLSHIYLRTVLSTYLGVSPAAIAYRTGPLGKPYLASPVGNLGLLHFNLSHSEKLVAVAVASNGEIGVDVEEMSSLARFDDFDLFGLTPILTSNEQASLRALRHDKRAIEILRIWTLKEAAAKASGFGLGIFLPKPMNEPVNGELAMALRPDEGEWSVTVALPADAAMLACAACWRVTNFRLVTARIPSSMDRTTAD